MITNASFAEVLLVVSLRFVLTLLFRQQFYRVDLYNLADLIENLKQFAFLAFIRS